MKKYLTVGLLIAILSVGCSTFSVSAKSSSLNEASNYFILSLLSKDIQRAVSEYYKEENVSVGSPDSIFIKYGHDDNNGVVEVFQSEKGHELPNSYVVKVKITPQKKGMLGKDTITFGIEPVNRQDGGIKVNMLEYKHIDIQKNN